MPKYVFMGAGPIEAATNSRGQYVRRKMFLHEVNEQGEITGQETLSLFRDDVNLVSTLVPGEPVFVDFGPKGFIRSIYPMDADGHVTI